MSELYQVDADGQTDEAVTAAHAAVQSGGLVVLPTDTVYGIGADAFDPAAVRRLLAAKGRGREMPPPVLIGNTSTLEGLAAAITADVRALIERFWPGALTVICPAQPTLRWDLGETRGTVAVRMPGHPVALDLLRRTGPMAVSSANLSGQPAATTAQEARTQLGKAVAVYLDAGPCRDQARPSSIVDATGETPKLVRAGAISLGELRAVVPHLLDLYGRAADDA